MQKILLAVDALHPDKNAMDFACYVANLTKSKVTGVFLENFAAEEKMMVKQLHGMPVVEFGVETETEEHKQKMLLIEKNISLFKEGCTGREANYSIHRDTGEPAKELVAESRFADVLILDSEMSFNNTPKGSLNIFVKEVLEKAECPVIIAPESFEGVNEIVMAYDASASAVFAIRQFTYLFPQYHDKKVVLLQANKNGMWEEADKSKLSEWLSNYYSNFQFEAVKGDAAEALFDYLLKRQHTFIVMGAYGRSALSRLLKASTADILIKTITHPIFITHR